MSQHEDEVMGPGNQSPEGPFASMPPMPKDLAHWMALLQNMAANQAQLQTLLSQLAMGCVTCHTCHGCMMDFRPILGNPVEVAHMTSPGTVYISHTKGTYFPLARISSMIPP